MDLNDIAGRRIRVLRRNLGLSQSDLAKRVNVAYQQIQKYETGKNSISINMLNKISKALETSPIQILGDDGSNEQASRLFSRDPHIEEENYVILSQLSKIDDPKIRASIIKLLKCIAYTSPDSTPEPEELPDTRNQRRSKTK